jgi:hypothetical protein
MIVTEVEVAGQALDPCDVLHTVTVDHGRSEWGADPEPSAATITVLASMLPPWSAGDTIHLAGPAGPVFTGRITDRALEHDQGLAMVTATATGALASLGRRVIGDVPWPVEPAQVRAARILALAADGGPWRIQEPGGEPQVTARDVDAQPALRLLTEIAASTGGTLFDTPTGEVVYQPLPARQTPLYPFQWLDFAPDLRWRDVAPDLRWRDLGVSPAARPTLDIPACLIGWQPAWSSTAAAIINTARVVYGPPPPDEGTDRPVQVATDERSIARHGRRDLRIDTQLQDAADAADRARRIITTQARDRWQMPEAVVLLRDASGPQRTALLGLRCGDRVRLHGIPAPSPAGSGGTWEGLVEGWRLEQATEEGGVVAVMTLRLSDPLLSLAVQRWRDAPPALRWRGMGTRKWRDLETWEAA